MALVVFLIGGYVIGIYFLFVSAITAKTKKGKIICFSLFTLWFLIPIINYAQDEFRNYMYQKKLDNTAPTKELIEEAFNKMNNPFIYFTEDFYSYNERHLTIKIDVFEEKFIEYASSRYQLVVKEMIKQNKEVKPEEVQEYMVEDVFGRYLFNLHDLHFQIWRKTTAPRKITIDLYYNNKLIYHTTSTDYYNVEGYTVEQIEQFYKFIKTEITDK
ncbi:hypothetical protein IM538_03275 [Cytobacillus suaedae]|nr:hypothetical protein IM538_03275 [Cytobacillus suaedae]